ncbi:hypothetical protein SEA_WIPEOUT_80 [Streptomyces phage Wipeout]|nr:hypothetical protein SEA_WIPEOUT_80 [Streptomyces phage Wipeout]QGH78968.1 hypothetical protein SEA_TOMSAWYER_81 [Streptomyces phage TomSawyer]
MEEAVRAEDLLRLLLLAKGDIVITAEELERAVNDRTRYSVGLSHDPLKKEFTFHLIGHDERPVTD